MASAPDELALAAFVGVAREGMPVPDEDRGRPILGLSWIWVGDDPADGEVVGRPLHTAARVAGEVVERTTYLDIQTGSERNRRRAYWKSSFVRELTDELLDAFVSAGVEANRDADLAMVELISLGGAIARVGEEDSAYGHRDATFDFLAVGSWEDPSEDERRMAAARGARQSIAQAGDAGVYVNNLGSEGIDRVREAYGSAKFDRLAALKRRYDPDNVFRHNQNIPPAPTG